MIDDATAQQIKQATLIFWQEQVTSSVFREIAKGKEIGHRIADHVDEQTTALLTREFVTKYQCNTNGKPLIRSMGDIWLECAGLYHPINVKSGVAGREGHPNMVSLKKVLAGLACYQIDSYYLLMVKVDIGENSIEPTIYFVDMLDYLEYVTFDSGPGQIMLRAAAFFEAFVEGYVLKPLTVMQKVGRLMKLLEDADRRLAANRAKKLGWFREQIEKYDERDTHIVTPATQESLNLR